jgi:hypothetical protein
MREYVAVHGCVRTLVPAVVAVTVAVGDTKWTFRLWAGSQAGAPGSNP